MFEQWVLTMNIAIAFTWKLKIRRLCFCFFCHYFDRYQMVFHSNFMNFLLKFDENNEHCSVCLYSINRVCLLALWACVLFFLLLLSFSSKDCCWTKSGFLPPTTNTNFYQCLIFFLLLICAGKHPRGVRIYLLNILFSQF